MLSRQFLCCCVLVIGCALVAQPAGASGMCAAGDVPINCGQGPQCATSPAVCCYGKICGGGMVCAQTARGPECGVPNITRCGQYTCGEGMICIQTPRGPECGAAGEEQGPVVGDAGWMRACASFPERPSAAECACSLREMRRVGMTPDEISLMVLTGQKREAEMTNRLKTWSQDRQVRFLQHVFDTDPKACPKQ